MIKMRSKADLEIITCQISKDLCKYELTFPELVITLGWILDSIAQRVHFGTHEWKKMMDEFNEEEPKDENQKRLRKQ
jgi:hypothetical protein